MSKPMNYEGANCTKRNPEEFFPEKGTAQIQARDAKAICNGTVAGMSACIRLSECLEYALDNRERFGVWGGKSERERTRIIQERKRQAIYEATPEYARKTAYSARAKIGWSRGKQRQQRLITYGIKFFTNERKARDARMGSRGSTRKRESSTEADRGTREDR